MLPLLPRILTLCFFVMATPLMAQSEKLSPPVAKKAPMEMIHHSDKRVDDYFWLREKNNPEVTAYLKAENAYTDTVLQPLAGLREQLYKEMLARIKETDQNVPYRMGEYFYYSRTEEGKQYPIYCRKKGSLDAVEEVLLDLNELAQGKAFLALGVYDVSPDGKWLAYPLKSSE